MVHKVKDVKLNSHKKIIYLDRHYEKQSPGLVNAAEINQGLLNLSTL